MSELSGAASVPVSVVVLTFNEERNLADCLESVSGWTRAIFVVDSGSTDRTRQIAERFGAHLVTHPFENHSAQWAWALETLPFSTSWLLGLDADQRVTPELRTHIAERLSGHADGSPHGFYVARRQVFRGRWIRHGGYYPKYLLKLFRREYVRLDPGELVDHHFEVAGPVEILRGDLIEDNRNEYAIAEWTAKHNRYAALQAVHELTLNQQDRNVPFRMVFGTPDDRTRWLKSIWARLPLFVRPFLYVTYRYILRGGFLDGKQGFIFHVLQSFWYRLLVDINIDERRSAGPTPPGAGLHR